MRLMSTINLDARYNGIINASTKVFDKVLLWNPKEKPIFDTFDEIKPDVVFCSIEDVNRTFMMACNEYKDIKIVLFGEGIPQKLNPDVVCAKPSTSRLIRKHIEDGDNKTLYVKSYADVCKFWNQDTDEIFNSDVSFYSNHTLEDTTEKIGLLASLSGFCKVKIAGPVRIPLPEYLGTIKTERVIPFINSSKIAIDWDGRNLLDFAANGVFTMTTVENKLFPALQKNRPIDSVKIEGWLKDSSGKARIKKARQAQKAVLNEDTCFHRLADILFALNLPTMAEDSLKELDKIKCTVLE